jgi:hypothetical protein
MDGVTQTEVSVVTLAELTVGVLTANDDDRITERTPVRPSVLIDGPVRFSRATVPATSRRTGAESASAACAAPPQAKGKR